MTKRHYKRATAFRPTITMGQRDREKIEEYKLYKTLWVSEYIEIREVAKKTLMIYVSPVGFRNIWGGAMSCRLRGRPDRETRHGVLALISMLYGQPESVFARALAALLRARCGVGMSKKLDEIGAEIGSEQ